VNAIRADSDTVLNAVYTTDGFGPRVEDLLHPKIAVDEVRWIGCVWDSARRLHLWDIARVAVFFGELLDTSAQLTEIRSGLNS
jgi:hypothetical protein